ncbi:MAG: nucleoside transporter C-terminal domain-containing protein, partial [Pirellulales bacterium]
QPKTMGHVEIQVEKRDANLIGAAASGAADGMKLALNVAAMLIAFLAIIAMLNGLIGWTGSLFGQQWTLENALSYIFWPLAWIMGIPGKDCFTAAELLGTKMVANEFVAYLNLGNILAENSESLSPRSVTILTYALCGFANFGSIGIQLGGIGGIAPERRGDLARLGLRAMLGGTLAAFMTACVAGILI